MPRPRSFTNMVAASVDGAMLFWVDGTFSGDNEVLLANVRRAALTHVTMLLHPEGPAIEADDSDVVGATAALLAARPGRVAILEAPQRVVDLYPQHEEDSEVLEGVEQVPYESLYSTPEERELFGSSQNDPRVKLVSK